MDFLPKKHNILTFKGIFPGDFLSVDNAPPQRKTEQASMKQETIYTEIPKRFNGPKTWIKTSNLKCWTCDLLFKTYPRFVPTNPGYDAEGQFICEPHGNFCCDNCVIYYIMKNYAVDSRWDIIELVLHVNSLFTGKKREKIMPSPDKTKRKEYCGNGGITVKEYQDKINALNVEYDLSSFKLDHFRA